MTSNLMTYNNRSLFSHTFGCQKSEIQVSARPCFLHGLWWAGGTASTPRLPAGSPQHQPPTAHQLLFCVSVF